MSYAIDGGAFELVTLNEGDSRTVFDDFGSALVTANIGSGASLVIKVAMANNAGSEYSNLDSVKVTASGSTGAILVVIRLMRVIAHQMSFFSCLARASIAPIYKQLI